MRARFPTSGLVGRAIAATGAVLLAIALVQSPAEGDSRNFREVYQRLDITILVVVAAVVVLLLVSLAAGQGPALFIVGVLGAVVLGFFLLISIEFKFEGYARGWYLALAGSAGILAGAAVALVPMLSAREGEPELAFLPAESSRAAAPDAGWYPDPSGQARLRYWDGQSWSAQTQ